jgi:4-amino-4-deoxy-L-arabinose transferase-like glycosyltransferase
VLFGSATALVVYWLGKRVNRHSAGALAAMFLAVSFLHVRDSHYGVPDVTAPFFICLTILFCVLAYQKHDIKYVLLAAVSLGLSVAIKWSIWPVGIPVMITTIVYFQHRIRQTPYRRSRLLLALILVGLCLIAGFTLGGFQLLLQPTTYLSYALREVRAGEAGGFGFWQIDTVSGWSFYLKTLLYGLGIVLLSLGITGFIRRSIIAITRRDTISVLLVSFPLVYYLMMGSTQHYFARYALPLVPFLALYAAEAVIAVFDWLKARNHSMAMVIATLLAIAALTPPMVASAGHDALLTRADTRTFAKEWIEANLPAGAKIAADWPMHTPPLSTTERPIPASAGKHYDVNYVGESGLSEHTLDWYRQQGYDYLIASSFIYQIPLVFPQQDADRKAFYASLALDLPLVKEFSASSDGSEPPFLFDEIYGPAISMWQRERPGPTIKIYQLASK